MKLLSIKTLLLGAELTDISDAINDLIKSAWGPMLAVATTLTLIYGIILGLRFWYAQGDEQKVKTAKKAVVQFVVGIFVIFGVVFLAPMLISALATWAGK